MSFVGADVSAKKTQPMAEHRVFLGTACGVGTAAQEGIVTFTPKASTIGKIVSTVQMVHRTRRLAAGATAKLRGQWQWAASNAYGRVGRFGTWHLKQHQYYSDSDEVDDTFLRVLTFMAELASALPVRTVQVVGLPGPPLIVYSDASWNDADDNRLGWIVADPVSGLATGYTMLLTPEFVASWCPRTQQIAMAESCAGVIVPLHNWKQFRGRDVIWFIDNEAACAALIRGSNSAEDVQDVAETAAFFSSLLDARVWYEWIDSASNVSGGLSRVGTRCPVAHAICADVLEVEPVGWQGRQHVCALLRYICR